MSVLYIVTSNVTRIELLMTVLFWYRRACRLIEYGIGLADGVPPGAQATSHDRDRDCGHCRVRPPFAPFPPFVRGRSGLSLSLRGRVTATGRGYVKQLWV